MVSYSYHILIYFIVFIYFTMFFHAIIPLSIFFWFSSRNIFAWRAIHITSLALVCVIVIISFSLVSDSIYHNWMLQLYGMLGTKVSKFLPSFYSHNSLVTNTACWSYFKNTLCNAAKNIHAIWTYDSKFLASWIMDGKKTYCSSKKKKRLCKLDKPISVMVFSIYMMDSLLLWSILSPKACAHLFLKICCIACGPWGSFD